MSQPMDPHNLPQDEGSEYSWGSGLFPPGIAGNEAQKKWQDDFGDNMVPPQHDEQIGSNYARAVADRRTDPCDPESNRDFTVEGNPDRYGGNPALVKAEPEPNVSHRHDRPLGLPPLQRKG